MTIKIRWPGAVALSTLAIIGTMPISALSQAAQGDPPSRVARLNYFSGSVTLEPAGATDWSYVQLNRPLTAGDQLWADNGARAELHIGSTALRLDQQTALDIVDLDDTTMQLKVTQGTLTAHVRVLPAGQQIEIDTPNVALQATRAGSFRVDVAPDGSSTTVTLRSGTATLYGDDGSFQMSAGQQIRFAGTDLQQQEGGSAPAPDAFDQWVASRDRAEDNSISARYVSREIPGYEDLDANGTWRDDQTYGEVWVPTIAVSAGWVPYHAGHWAWIAPWGWTWIDDAPWGFAPFHYGRWAYVDEVWAWVPGPVIVARPPVYAPALVAFVGGGGGFGWGINLSIGAAVSPGVAWIPLGPGEVWHPAYGYSPNYYNRVNNVNITNIHNTTIVNNTYINQSVPGAITAVPANAFVRGQSVAQAAQPLTAQQIAHAQIGAGAPSIAPVRASFSAGMRQAMIGQPATLAQRQVIATRAPVVPAAYHDTLAQHFANNGGRVVGAGEPVVRTAAFATAERHVSPGASVATQGFHVINKAQVRPIGPQGTPVRAGEAVRKPHVPQESGHRHGDAGPHEAAKHAPAPQVNGLPHPTGARATQQEGEHNVHPRESSANTARVPEGPHVPIEQQHRVAPQADNHEPLRNADHPRTNEGGSKPGRQPTREDVHAQRREPQPNAAQQPHPKEHRESDGEHGKEHRPGSIAPHTLNPREQDSLWVSPWINPGDSPSC